MKKEFLSYQTIMFDLDGTLIDSAANLVAALNDVIRPILPSDVPYEGARRLAGIGSRHLLRYAFKYHKTFISDEGIEALVPKFMDAYAKRIDSENSFFKDADTTLKALKEMGKNVLLVTNKPRRFTPHIIENLSWTPYFDGIFCPDDVSAKKPDAAHLHEALSKSNLPHQNALMVGDSIADYDAAVNANIPIMMVGFYGQTPEEYPKARYFINSYS
ncbi:MAG: phosphoglycolate phosphatase [Alphaproteobacteria bacterium]|jgi:phosphoglycolate phosphatase